MIVITWIAKFETNAFRHKLSSIHQTKLGHRYIITIVTFVRILYLSLFLPPSCIRHTYGFRYRFPAISTVKAFNYLKYVRLTRRAFTLDLRPPHIFPFARYHAYCVNVNSLVCIAPFPSSRLVSTTIPVPLKTLTCVNVLLHSPPSSPAGTNLIYLSSFSIVPRLRRYERNRSRITRMIMRMIGANEYQIINDNILTPISLMIICLSIISLLRVVRVFIVITLVELRARLQPGKIACNEIMFFRVCKSRLARPEEIRR